jgi:hypothetical protein
MHRTTKEEEMTARTELAHRTADGIEVALYWTKVGDLLTLEVYDTRSEERFELEVPRDRALDAFRHPFAYLTAPRPRARLQVAA